jgi:hypothetical protein
MEDDLNIFVNQRSTQICVCRSASTAWPELGTAQPQLVSSSLFNKLIKQAMAYV